jgi:hypothetical protein
MHLGNLPLLHQLALEFNTLINHTVSNTTVGELGELLNNDDEDLFATDDDDDELDTQLQQIEEEMTVLLATSSKKRKIVHDSSSPPKKKKRYDTKKLYFTNPITLERQEFTFEYSIWYCNYVSDPHPERPKWSKMFRNRFRMPYDCFLDLVEQCKDSDIFKRWASGNDCNPYNKKKILPLKLLDDFKII